ncbi:MAG: hypothetical protein E7252_04110 [Lachnospira sp.]|nr:hypothetical protein [Lachnospira sp.]
MKRNFILCGLIGVFLEVIWTGFMSFTNSNFSLMATTSLWMFPIYGCAAFIKPISRIICNYNFIIRGGIYVMLIFTGEFIFGMILKNFGICPWNYNNAPYNVCGVIRLDYAPLWFISGLIFEKFLTSNYFNCTAK